MFVRSALILRKQELQEALAAAPADIAIKREKWFSSERPADERSLHKAKVAMQAMEDELLEVNAGIGIVDRLLAEELAKQQAEAQAKLEARLGELRVGQADAFRVCGEKLADLFAAWQVFAATQEALHTTWLTSPDRDGVGPGHLLDPAPVTFEAMLGVLYRVSLRRDVGYQPLGPVLDLVPDLGADTRLEIGGHWCAAVQPILTMAVLAFRRPRPARPSNWCSSCGQDFTSLEYFDRHRVGEHAPDWPEGNDGRRCLAVDELVAIAFEQDAAGRWFDPARAQRAFSAPGDPTERPGLERLGKGYG